SPLGIGSVPSGDLDGQMKSRGHYYSWPPMRRRSLLASHCRWMGGEQSCETATRSDWLHRSGTAGAERGRKAGISRMAKAYWVAMYRVIKDREALAHHQKLALPAIHAAGGRVLARGLPAQVYEAGLSERLVVIEFDS